MVGEGMWSHNTCITLNKPQSSDIVPSVMFDSGVLLELLTWITWNNLTETPKHRRDMSSVS